VKQGQKERQKVTTPDMGKEKARNKEKENDENKEGNEEKRKEL
jgi:hypothetical protein